ncbi:hypothetical protein MHU86_2287 [Fragilaria crotonensis]|nr:hypothetical protein MHU86_2287 [Fragilaria crotonensis]
MLEFETGSDGMAYLIASRIKGERKAFNVEEIAEKDEEMEKKERKQYMDINEAHQKFGHATESGRIHADATFNDDERPRIDGEIDERSDDDRDDQVRKPTKLPLLKTKATATTRVRSRLMTATSVWKRRTYLSFLRENAPEMAENETNDKVDEIDQTERPQRSVTRLENEMKRLGIDEPIRIETTKLEYEHEVERTKLHLMRLYHRILESRKRFVRRWMGRTELSGNRQLLWKSTIFCHVMPGRSFQRDAERTQAYTREMDIQDQGGARWVTAIQESDRT